MGPNDQMTRPALTAWPGSRAVEAEEPCRVGAIRVELPGAAEAEEHHGWGR